MNIQDSLLIREKAEECARKINYYEHLFDLAMSAPDEIIDNKSFWDDLQSAKDEMNLSVENFKVFMRNFEPSN